MVRQLLGNIKGPQGAPGEQGEVGPPGPGGQDGVDGRDAELEVYNSENMLYPHHPRSQVNGNVTIIDGVETFSSTGTNTNTHLQYDHQHTLLEDKVYTISFDVVNDGVVDMDSIWIINTDGSHSNYSIHHETRHIDSNIFGVPQNERFRCYITFKPPYDLVGHLRVGSLRGEGNTGSTQISRVSLTQSYDMAWQPNDHLKPKAYVECEHRNTSLVTDETTQLSVWGFRSNTSEITVSSGAITLPPGRYIIDYTAYLVDGAGTLTTNVRVNGSNYAYNRGDADHSLSTTAVLNIEEYSEITITYYYTGTQGHFSQTWRNRTRIIEL